MNGKELSMAIGIITTLLVFCVFNSSASYDPWEKDYTIVRKLGGGYFGDTWLLKNETGNTTFVLKKIKSESATEDPPFYLSGVREAYFGAKLSKVQSHIGKEHVGRFVEYFSDENSIQLISIFEGTQLKELLYNVDGDELKASDWSIWLRTTTEGKQVMKNLIHQLLLAVKFCHDNGIVHRDIKPSNIVVCFENTNQSCSVVHPSNTSDIAHLRLIDLGSAVDTYAEKFFYGKDGPTWNGIDGEQYKFFMPPEAIIDRTWSKYPLSTKYDVWTVGQTTVELILGTPGVFELTDYEALRLMKEISYSDQYSIFRTAGMAEQCIGLPDSIVIEKMNKLSTCTDNGYADYIRNRDPLHLGFQDVELLKLVRLLLKADPDLRINVDEALRHPYFGGTRPSSMFNYCASLACAVIFVGFCVWVKIYRSPPQEENKTKKELKNKKKNRKKNKKQN